MTNTAQLRAPGTDDHHQVVNHPVEDADPYRQTMLAALRVAHARAKLVVHHIEEIGFDLREGHLTPLEAMRECVNLRIDALFPRESDGG